MNLENVLREYSPHVALAVTGTPEDLALIELARRIDPAVQIIHVRNALLSEESLARRWNLRALVTAGRGRAVERRGDLVKIRLNVLAEAV